MKYNYLDFIAGNNSSFLRSRFVLVCISLFLIVLIIIMNRNDYLSINDYNKINIKVNEIGISTMLKKPNATFNLNKKITVEALRITSIENVFYINKNLKEFWPQILKTVNKGDNLLLFYQVVEDNKEIVQMEYKSNILFSIKDLIKKFKPFKFICYFLLSLNITILIIISYKRKKIVQST